MTVNWNFELTTPVLIGIASGALIFAWWQVRAMHESNRKLAESAVSQERQARARVLLSLDERWESETVTTAIAELQALISEVENDLVRRHPETNLADLRRRSAPIYLAKLREMERREPSRYLRIFRICAFFETVCYVVKAGYLTLSDVFELFSVSVNATAMVFRLYIEEVVRQEGANPTLYSNYRWLIAEIEKWERETGIFASFLDAALDFAGSEIVDWKHNQNDSPDILCIDQLGTRIGVEMTEWLDEQQTRDFARWEKLCRQ
jgi:hypothetical protein